MDASHILVGGLTAISIALLVWIEIRSRRIAAAPEQNSSPVDSDEAQPPPQKRDRTLQRVNNGRMGVHCVNRAGSNDSCSQWPHLSARSPPEVRSPSAG